MARALSMRGMLVVPQHTGAGQPEPLLWRVLQFERCHALGTTWADAGATFEAGQFAGVFPETRRHRGALIYLGAARRLDPRPLEWPPAAMDGLDSRTYDRESASEQAALMQAVAADGLPVERLGAWRFVTRVRFDRRPNAPEALPLTLSGVAGSAWARLYSEGEPREDQRPLLCRSSLGQPVAAYEGAPAVTAVDITARQTTGSGWHAAEQAGQERFRWTNGEADLLFVANRQEPLLLRIEAQPAVGDWSKADLRVTLNGQPAACRDGAPPCEWLLPAAAMRAGLNVLTLHSASIQAPPPDPRRLGLMVRSAQLTRP
jgi:hypothetical protein